ncbi:hypothetical protein V5799_012857 [Amblyomma americanum]|uniref:Peptidase M13 N-terminal domain-containing protein n=1 Tax=Amblyomma americanum TaxID=6943 RepID=A0AAQ4E7H0_AMBAM
MAVLPAAEQGPHSQVAEEVPSLPQADKDASYWPVSDKQLPSLPAGSATPPALPGLEERPALMSSQTEPAVLPGIEKEALASGSGKGTPRSSRSGKGSVRSTKTEKDPFPLSNQPSTSPPQPPRGRNSSLVKGVAVLLVLVIALLVVMVILKGAKPPPKGDVLDGNACQSDDCKRVARLLLESLQPNAPPCADFYQLVCGRWKHAEGQGEVLFQRFVDEITELARNEVAPPTNQAPVQKSSLAYQACEDIVAKNNTSMGTVEQILQEAGFYSPPSWTGPVDALNSTFYLGVKWCIAAPIRLTYARSSYRGVTIRMAPSESLKAYVERRQTPNISAQLKDDFAVLEAMIEQNKTPKLTFDEWMQVDTSVTMDAMPMFKSMNFAGWNETNIQDAIQGMSRKQWDDVLGLYFNHTPALRFYVDSLELFKKFIELPNAVGADKAQAYVRLYMTEMLAMKVYAPWVVREFPTYDSALNYQRRYCFAIIEQTAGYAFLTPYVTKAFPAETREDIKELQRSVRDAYDSLFTDIDRQPNVKRLPSYSTDTGRVFDLLRLFDAKSLERNYAIYADMTSDPLVNWKQLMLGRASSFWTHVTMGTGGVLPTELIFYEIDSLSYDFSLRPDVAVVPTYGSSTPEELKLASLGFVMASAMAEILYTTQANASVWNETATCLLEQQNSANGTEVQPIVLLERLVALAAIVSASSANNGSTSHLPGLAEFAGRKLLYVAWCYQYCGEKAGRLLCNEPLKELSVFADTFQCDTSAAMRKTDPCTSSWFSL